jgi:uncharacterized protein (TIGR01777 family)
MKIALTGATGFIGKPLLRKLREAGHELHVLSRRPVDGQGITYSIWPSTNDPVPVEAVDGRDAIIHLAGEPVSQRWTGEVKRKIRDSRLNGTRQLVDAIAKAANKPRVLVSGSAIGYYGSRGDEVLTETSRPGSGFLEDICVEWEREADRASSSGVRVVKIRTGIVLGTEGGAMAKMLPPFRAGIGGTLGDGRQWMSWIHLEDLVRMFEFAVESGKAKGAWNGTAPHPVTNLQFTKQLASVLHRPAVFPVPSLALKLLYGEMASVILGSQRALPASPQLAGFQFTYPELGPALENLLRH